MEAFTSLINALLLSLHLWSFKPLSGPPIQRTMFWCGTRCVTTILQQVSLITVFCSLIVAWLTMETMALGERYAALRTRMPHSNKRVMSRVAKECSRVAGRMVVSWYLEGKII